MRFVKSFFNATLYKKHLTRYWPIAAVWLVGWALAIPVSLWAERDYVNIGYVELYATYLPAAAWLTAGAAVITAVAVLFHLFRSPAAGFVGALPLRRETVFCTAFLAGYTLMTAPLILVSGVTWLIEVSLGIAHPAIFQFLGSFMLLSFFWLSFAFLCCIITGNGVAAVAFFGIFNAVAYIMEILVTSVLTGFLYGFKGLPTVVRQAVVWLTPLEYLGNTFHPEVMAPMAGVVTDYWELALVYAGAGFLMLLAALGLHHIRKAERAGDLIAFRPLGKVFLVCVTVCGGLALGLLFCLMLFRDISYGWQLAVCCAVAAALSWFIAQMLLRKTLRVFKATWRGALIAAAGFVLVILAIDADLIGFTTRVPDPAQVRWAEATYSGNVDPIAWEEGLLYTGDDIRAVVELHEYLVKNRDTKDLGREYVTLNLTYHMGLGTITRQYTFRYNGGGVPRDVLDDALVHGRAKVDLARKLDWAELAGDYDSAILSTADTARFMEALRQDVEAGRYKADPQWIDGEQLYTPCVHLWYGGQGRAGEHQVVHIRPEFTAMWTLLEELDLRGSNGEDLLARASREKEPSTVISSSS